MGGRADFGWFFAQNRPQKKGLSKVFDRQEMFLGLTGAGGEDAASTAGQEAGVTSRLRTSCAHGA
jgi:hypothetical protein